MGKRYSYDNLGMQPRVRRSWKHRIRRFVRLLDPRWPDEMLFGRDPDDI
jgi:hypothetical protein